MTPAVEPLILDLLEWIARQERMYAEVLDVWRTSCPRLPVPEDATDRGLILREYVPGRGVVIRVTPSGYALLEREQRSPESAQAQTSPSPHPSA